MLLAVKLLISAGLIVLATELAKRSTLAGGIILSLPLTSVIALCWVWLESKSSQKVSDLSMSTLWMVIPSLVFFPTLALLLRAKAGFVLALPVSCLGTAAVYWVFMKVFAHVL